jgi:MFS family permease
VRRSREFRLLYAGQAATFFGTMITYVAMPYQAYRLSHSSLVVGLLSVTELVPLVTAGLAGGAVADALERRRVIVATESGLLAGSVALAVNALAWHQLRLLFTLAAVLAFLGTSARRWRRWCPGWSPAMSCPPRRRWMACWAVRERSPARRWPVC